MSGHGQTVTATGKHRGRLLVVLSITLTVMVVEVIGGLVTGSLALLADAGHMLTDAAGVGAALIAAALAARPTTDARTYGMLRAEILAALANAVLLGGVAGWVLVEAVARWGAPPEVDSGLMLLVAAGGAAANLVSLLILRAGQRDSLNLRGAYLEIVGDLLGSLAVVVAGLIIATTGYARADALASAVIGVMILPRAWSLLRDVLDVLLEATPRGVDLATVRGHIVEVPGVVDVHDLHAWTITSGLPVISAHVVLKPGAEPAAVLEELCLCLTGDFDVEHSTLQLETSDRRRLEEAGHR